MAQDDMVLIVFYRYEDAFEGPQWSTVLNGPYEVTNPLQALVMEAAAKGMAVVVQAALVDPNVLLGLTDADGKPIEPDETPSESEA